MSKIRVLSDHVANQIAAGEVVERPASVAKELVENSIDAGARRVEVDVEGGGRRLLRVADDGCGMMRDDAVLAFERHATSKISSAEDLTSITTLGFRGEALASIASVARVELITQTEDESEGTRVLVEGGRMRDVAPAARPRGTTISVRDLFFNVPARRKFLRSEATESFHLTNLVTHYALAHPEIAFTLTNNGREVLRAAPASDLRERAYQIFGAEFLDGLLEVKGERAGVARVGGYVSAPRERRTTRDAQYLFVNGRFVRDRLVARSLSEGYRSVLPHGTYPAALLFLEVPPEEVDVNVHPAKTEVRFRRASAVADAVRDTVRGALATGGYLRLEESFAVAPDEDEANAGTSFDAPDFVTAASPAGDLQRPADDFERPADDEERPAGDERATDPFREATLSSTVESRAVARRDETARREPTESARRESTESGRQESIAFGSTPHGFESAGRDERSPRGDERSERGDERSQSAHPPEASTQPSPSALDAVARSAQHTQVTSSSVDSALPPLGSAAGLVREAAFESLTSNIRPLGQLEESFIVATDAEGLLLIDQHVAHERILFDEYRRLERVREVASQNLLVPETFDLTPAQAAAFDEVSAELERLGFGLMRLSGRTVAVRAVPAALPAAEARNLLAEILDAVDAEKRGRARATLRDEIAARLACHAAIRAGTPLTHEKMSWLIERLLRTSSPTTCPHGRPVILRLTKRDIERGFQRP
ncbi:MAG TPA: DNA mismatch repair endonuclease MutL [Pyrinomonadaceae bacterium]|nr:DNA mismatch repair endonuclease MutL [Pyrinomonadaceae bacterium]